MCGVQLSSREAHGSAVGICRSRGAALFARHDRLAQRRASSERSTRSNAAPALWFTTADAAVLLGPSARLFRPRRVEAVRISLVHRLPAGFSCSDAGKRSASSMGSRCLVRELTTAARRLNDTELVNGVGSRPLSYFYCHRGAGRARMYTRKRARAPLGEPTRALTANKTTAIATARVLPLRAHEKPTVGGHQSRAQAQADASVRRASCFCHARASPKLAKIAQQGVVGNLEDHACGAMAVVLLLSARRPQEAHELSSPCVI